MQPEGPPYINPVPENEQYFILKNKVFFLGIPPTPATRFRKYTCRKPAVFAARRFPYLLETCR